MTDFADATLYHLPERGFGPITLSVHEQGDGPAVVFSHGFPELAYSWRHQLPAVAGRTAGEDPSPEANPVPAGPSRSHLPRNFRGTCGPDGR